MMPISFTSPRQRLTAKEVIDRAHDRVPASRSVDNRRAGRLLRTMIEDEQLGETLDERARFDHSEDPASPVDCAVYDVRSDTDIDALAEALGTKLIAPRT